jgi:isopenicillin N synthase-like dioxygenase
VTSQNGEDGIIARIFDLLPFQSSRVCVDVGAWDGRHLSNTYSLLVGIGDDERYNDTNTSSRTKWKGVLIEADRSKFQQLTSLYASTSSSGDDDDVICICATVSCEPNSSSSLRSILNRVDCSYLQEDFDFLCIDVDGIDYWLLLDVLSGNENDYDNTTRRYRPKVICIEFNPTMPIDLIYIQPRSDSIRHGSSLSALVELANSFDYVLVETTVFNAFFVPKELYDLYLSKEVPDTSIEALYEITMGTSMYQLYDGTLKLWGCKKMLWHRLPLDEKKMQMLTLQEREFPFAPGDESIESDSCRLDSEIGECAIDMSSYCRHYNGSSIHQNESEAKRECFTKLNSTLQKDGFALVKGTNISSNLCIKALSVAKSFLHEADESVRRSCLTKDRARRGYSPMCTENFASLIGERGPNDLVKKFRVGPQEGRSKSLSSLHQPNAWPSSEVWDLSPDFQSAIEEYYEKLRVAADCILRAICDGIVAENASLEESIRVISESTRDDKEATQSGGDAHTNNSNHTSILTLLGYQSGSRHKKGSKGYLNPLVAAHTDVGMITVLLFDNGACAALQRSVAASGVECQSQRPEHEEWMDVNLPSTKYLEEGNDPIFVVNVGDCLSELTGGYLRSTLHRVIPRPFKSPQGNNGDLSRTSLALFVGLEPLAQLVLPSGESVTYEDWRRQRIARALDVMKK